MGPDLRCCAEPPIGVEPMTYALRVRRDGVHPRPLWYIAAGHSVSATLTDLGVSA